MDVGNLIKNNSPLLNEQEINEKLEAKQNNLVSGENIKTINGNSIVGSGNLEITGGGGSGISDAPADGFPYARQDNNWSKVTPQSIGATVKINGTEYTADADGNIELPTVDIVITLGDGTTTNAKLVGYLL